MGTIRLYKKWWIDKLFFWVWILNHLFDPKDEENGKK